MNFKGIVMDQNNFIVIGAKGSGKTALGFRLLEAHYLYGNRKAYTFRHPKPDLLTSLPFTCINIKNFNELFGLTDSCLLIDEAQLVFSVQAKRINQELMELLALSRQNNVSIIFLCHNSYFINRGLFSYIDIKIIKEVNEGHWELERKHMDVLYRNKARVFGPANFYIDCDIFSGNYTFKKPDWFTEEFSNSYRSSQSKDSKDLFENIAQEVRQAPKEDENANNQ